MQDGRALGTGLDTPVLGGSLGVLGCFPGTLNGCYVVVYVKESPCQKSQSQSLYDILVLRNSMEIFIYFTNQMKIVNEIAL